MRTAVRCMPVLVVALLALALAGCPRKAPSATETQRPAAPAGAGPIEETGAMGAKDEAVADAAATGLTNEVVKNFMKSVQDDGIAKIMDETKDDLAVEDEDSPGALKQILEKAATNAQLDEMVSKYGFASAAEWTDMAKRLIPGLGHATVVVMTEAAGIEEGSDQFERQVAKAKEELAEMDEVFGEPTEQDLQVIIDTMRQGMEEKRSGRRTE